MKTLLLRIGIISGIIITLFLLIFFRKGPDYTPYEADQSIATQNAQAGIEFASPMPTNTLEIEVIASKEAALPWAVPSIVPFGIAVQNVNFATFTANGVKLLSQAPALAQAIDAIKSQGKADYWEVYCYWPATASEPALYTAFYSGDPDIFKAALVAGQLGTDATGSQRVCSNGFVTNFKSANQAYEVRLVYGNNPTTVPTNTLAP